MPIGNKKERFATALALWRQGKTYAHIGKVVGVTRQRVQQLFQVPMAGMAQLANRAGNRCESCQSWIYGHGAHAHHRDRNVEVYNALDNLQYLCISCHGKMHKELVVRIATLPNHPFVSALTMHGYKLEPISKMFVLVNGKSCQIRTACDRRESPYLTLHPPKGSERPDFTVYWSRARGGGFLFPSEAVPQKETMVSWNPTFPQSGNPIVRHDYRDYWNAWHLLEAK